AEHSFLLIIVAAHSLASLVFLLSDEFFELKLQRNCIFQQTASRPSEDSWARIKWNTLSVAEHRIESDLDA
ncbi:MAG: hypothetical protein WBL70_00845, partial [Candidatus Acidiferrales bacterium]